MRNYKGLFTLLFLVFATSCQRNSTETWEDVKTAGRYLQKSIYALWGAEEESRQIASEDEFLGPSENDFIPLQETDLAIAEPQMIPSSPIIEKSSAKFSVPSSRNNIFRRIHFDTDDHVIRNKEDLLTIARIANYLKTHPKETILVEGHCDKRAAADYNMALGMRRAHHIQVLLKKQGVRPQQIQTVSFGKEKLLSLGNGPTDHKMNRRAEFKLQTH